MKQKLVNIIGLIASVVIFLILVSSLIKSLKRINEGKALVKRNEAKLEKIQKENERLEEQLKIIQSDEFVEKQLRNKLGLVKEGEIVVVLPEADIVKKLSPIIPEEEEVKPKPNWQRWIELFK
ncbi:MAG TPA: septum formation initiator family protein [Patescibacteria group bacterium]|nr:septum formation initiator family protein [Patescibacteria group bacterium]